MEAGDGEIEEVHARNFTRAAERDERSSAESFPGAIALSSSEELSEHSVMPGAALLPLILGGDGDASGTRREENERRSRTTSVCVFLFFALFILFSCTIVLAIIFWHQYESTRLHMTWVKTGCTIVSAGIRQSQVNGKWRAEWKVLVEKREQTAYWNGGEYVLRKEKAQEIITRVGKEGKKQTCWIRSRPTFIVSMQKVHRRRVGQESVYFNVAWASTVFAALSGFLLTIVQRSLVNAMRNEDSLWAEEGTPRRVPKRGSRLTKMQAKRFVKEFDEELGCSELPSEWTCSICLDEASEGEQVNVATLPCSHKFHTRCIRRWLRRGSSTCPLCNWNVAQLFDEKSELALSLE